MDKITDTRMVELWWGKTRLLLTDGEFKARFSEDFLAQVKRRGIEPEA